ncbi:MAG: Tex family protein [Planctomycetia bacterium]|nr:Tex family protein [Planctomycetia bacterium]
MTEKNNVNLRQIARGMSIPVRQVESAAQLLDDGNTIPFIARYRKDATGGLDEEQLRQISSRLEKLRALQERKETILRSIEAQGKLTPELEEKIRHANTTKRLEDLYMPFKPRKQTLAASARRKGLEPFAQEILAATELGADLDALAQKWVSEENELPNVEEVLKGVGYILAETFSENADLRSSLREIFLKSATIVSSKSPELEKKQAEREVEESTIDTPNADNPNADAQTQESQADETPVEAQAEVVLDEASNGTPEVAETADGAEATEVAETTLGASDADSNTLPEDGDSVSTQPQTQPQTPTQTSAVSEKSDEKSKTRARAKQLKAQKKQKQDEQKEKAFQDYFSFEEAARKMPAHRILAINRGEQAKILRVKVVSDSDALLKAGEALAIPSGHPYESFLKESFRDALSRLILPSLERELRREMTETAEVRAVDVFAKNLRNLLLQPPIYGRRVLAIDPGYKHGCKLAALDQFGNFLEHGVIYITNKGEKLDEAKKKVVSLVEKYSITLIAIGNGTACRNAEDFVAGLLSNELAGREVAYMIVNEAGASVYSTSVLGREEFPNYDAILRSAISIGRRVLDPLSELVKIDPANIGVGLYQHDVKAKHLKESLEGVVESCVNFVGVDVNTASPALLRFVSGLNQLHARKIYEYRRANGPFRNREQLKNVPGVGEVSFVQAAGFLKITKGDNPLDATWIHPESYELALRVLEKTGVAAEDLRQKTAEVEAALANLDAAALAKEWGVGERTLKDIFSQLTRGGRDPREELPPPVFKKGIMALEDLQVGMELSGTVLNVVDFGAFVDIGLHESGLVHVSQIADKYIRDPHEVIAVGDVVRAWVSAVDPERRRVSLTMIDPSAPTSAATGGKNSEKNEKKSDKKGDEKGGKSRRRRRGRRSSAPSGASAPSVVPLPTTTPSPDVASIISPPKPTLRLVSEAPADFVPASQDRSERGGRNDRGDRSEKSDRGGRDGRRGGKRPQNDAPSQENEAREKSESPKQKRGLLEKYQYRKEAPKQSAHLPEEVKKGKAPMRGFDELAAFFKKEE